MILMEKLNGGFNFSSLIWHILIGCHGNKQFGVIPNGRSDYPKLAFFSLLSYTSSQTWPQS